jgi:acetolactate synthase-1/2/3 large subunit
MAQKYADFFIDSLVELGYTTCFFVGGGNVMHLIESARTRLNCVAVVNEVSAGIAAEYFNIANRSKGERAFAIVTAGPGLTNIVTSIGSAWMESRELLVVGGQARTEFLSKGTVRQMGHQEIDGVSIVDSITKKAIRIEEPIDFESISRLTELSRSGRKGPVFIELCLDVTATVESPKPLVLSENNNSIKQCDHMSWVEAKQDFISLLKMAKRPLLLVGTGLDFETFQANIPHLEGIGLPVATSWNAIDYVDYDSKFYAGRPDTYGMRWANAVVQQSDLLITVGSRLGLQQTGFNWEDFVPVGKIVQFDIDHYELQKANPELALAVECDVNEIFNEIVQTLEMNSSNSPFESWTDFIASVKATLPASEVANDIYESHVNPFNIVTEIGDIAQKDWNIVPCSSGGSYTSVMQAFPQKTGQLLPNNKGLASMGYGLAGAIGVAVARPNNVTILFEGDGGFAQNLSELGTVENRNLNIKFIINDNGGYASIRISQRAYFEGNYVGCDKETGVGLPKWKELFGAYGIPVFHVDSSITNTPGALDALSGETAAAFIIKVHADQPFLPKLTSRIFPDGTMKSNPLHLMMPPLSHDVADQVFRYLPEHMRYAE